MEHVNVFGDPKIVGPGVWWVIHSLAKQAIDPKSITRFIDFMNFLRDNFSCKNCRKHIQEYMKLHPFNDFIGLEDNGRKIGMFKWAWLFHNAVNTRIGKPYVEWETAFDMFYNEIEICSLNCEEAGNLEISKEDKPKETTSSEKTKKNIMELPHDDKKSKLVQGYFMSIGIPKTLKKNGIVSSNNDLVTYVK